MKPERQIIAMGGLTADGGDAALFGYVLQQARAAHPRVAYLATAKGDREPFVSKFFQRVEAGGRRGNLDHPIIVARSPLLAELDIASYTLVVWRTEL